MKRIGICLLIFLMAVSGANAEFSPAWSALHEEGSLCVSGTAAFETLGALSEESLAVVNGWFGRMSAALYTGKQEALVLMLDGQTVLAQHTADGEANEVGSALWLLNEICGIFEKTIPAREPLGMAQVFGLSGSAGFYSLLASAAEPKYVKDTVAIDNASSAAAYETYTLTGEQMNGVLALWQPEPDMCGTALAQWVRQAFFSDECRVRRYLDRDGADMGLQWTGHVVLEGDERKGTLMLAWTPGKGGTLTLSLPAVKGKNNLRLTLNSKCRTNDEGVNTLTVSGNVRHTWNGETENAEWDVSLRCEQEHVTGKAAITATQNGVTQMWTVVPDLTNGQGNLSVSRKTGGKTDIKCTAAVTVRSAEPPAETADRMSAALYKLLGELDAPQRARLAFDLRGADWMTAETVPAIGQMEKTDAADGEQSIPVWRVEDEDW